MSEFNNISLTGPIVVDGQSYDGCRFTDAELIYRGGTPPVIQGCQFENVRFTFQGEAWNTILFLHSMSPAESGLRPVLLGLFPALTAHAPLVANDAH